MRSLAGLLGAGVVLAASASASAQYGPPRADLPPRPQREVILATETEGCPPGYHPETRVRSGPVIGGAITTGIGILLAGTGIAQMMHKEEGGELLTLSGGISLAVGLPLLIYGLGWPRDVYVRDSVPRVALGVLPTPKNPRLSLAVSF